MTGRGWVWSLLLSQYVGYVQTVWAHIKGNAAGTKETAAVWIIDQSCVSVVAQNFEKVHNLGKKYACGGLKWISHSWFVASAAGNPFPKVFLSLCHV